MDEEWIGVLFDIDALGGPSSYGAPCWRILMKHLDLREMESVLFFQGDLEIQASQRPYCFCIAIAEAPALTGREGIAYFRRKLSAASDAGLFPPSERFVEDNLTGTLIPAGSTDIEGRFRMSEYLGELGDLGLVRSGKEFDWTVLPDDDSLALFAHTYLRKTGGEDHFPLDDGSRELCESVLREMGERSTIAAFQRAGLEPGQLKTACRRLVRQVWPRWWQFWK